MNFIDAIVAISQNHHFKFCENKEELEGKYPSICVYYRDEFCGKLRWPVLDQDGSARSPAKVDEELENKLLEASLTKED